MNIYNNSNLPKDNKDSSLLFSFEHPSTNFNWKLKKQNKQKVSCKWVSILSNLEKKVSVFCLLDHNYVYTQQKK